MLSLKKTRSKSATKTKVGGVKKLSWKKLTFLAVAGILLVSSLGYAGFVQWKARDLKAKAAGWTDLTDFGAWPGERVAACKTAIPTSGYGPLWKATVIYTRPQGATKPVTVGAQLYRNGQKIGTGPSTSSWWAGIVTTTTIYGSQLYPDMLGTSSGDDSRGGETGPVILFSELTNC